MLERTTIGMAARIIQCFNNLWGMYIKIHFSIMKVLPGFPIFHVLMKVVSGGTASPSPTVTSLTKASSGSFTLG